MYQFEKVSKGVGMNNYWNHEPEFFWYKKVRKSQEFLTQRSDPPSSRFFEKNSWSHFLRPLIRTSTVVIWRWLFHQSTVEPKKWFFRPPEASNDPMTKPFELGRLQMIPSNTPISNSSWFRHSDHIRKPKLRIWQK